MAKDKTLIEAVDSRRKFIQQTTIAAVGLSITPSLLNASSFSPEKTIKKKKQMI